MKEEYKNKKTSTSVMKRVFSVFVAIVVLTVSALASEYLPTNSQEALLVGINSWSGQVPYYIYSNYDEVKLYTSSYNTNGATIYAISRTSASYIMFTQNAGEIERLIDTYSQEYNVYYSILELAGYLNVTNTEITQVNSLSEALELYGNGNGNGNGETNLSINLPSGNIAVIEMAGGSNQVSISVPIGTGGNQTSPQTNINDIKIGSYSTKPSSVSSTMSGIEYPVWTGTGNPNIFGKYFSWKTSFDNAISGDKYLVVSNPLQVNTNIYDNAWSLTCTINVQNATNYWIVPTQTQYDGTTHSWEGIDSGEEYTGTYDESNGEWNLVDGDGNPVTPNAGGNTTVNNFTGSVNDWLKHIAEEISSFFNGPINAIQTVAGAISQFASTLKALYIWLPGPVQSLLTSAIMLAITIGVIKVFI